MALQIVKLRGLTHTLAGSDNFTMFNCALSSTTITSASGTTLTARANEGGVFVDGGGTFAVNANFPTGVVAEFQDRVDIRSDDFTKGFRLIRSASNTGGSYSWLSEVGAVLWQFNMDGGSPTDSLRWDFNGAGKMNLTEAGQLGIGAFPADASSKLELLSTTQGFLKPRMTEAQRDAISTPATGLEIYNTDTSSPDFFDGVVWRALAPGPVWLKFTFSHTAFQTAALTNNSVTLNLPENGMLEKVVIKQSTQFAGTGIGNYSISLGTLGDGTKYSEAHLVSIAPSNTQRLITISPDIESFTAVTNLRVTATSTGANLDQSTAGSVDIYVQVSILPTETP